MSKTNLIIVLNTYCKIGLKLVKNFIYFTFFLLLQHIMYIGIHNTFK